MAQDSLVLSRLKNYVSESRAEYNQADDWYREDTTKRNEWARGAASDHRTRTEGLLDNFVKSGDLSELRHALQENRNHAEWWEGHCLRAGKSSYHDNSYAGAIHRRSAERYRSLLDLLDCLPDVHVSYASSGLRLVVSVSGNSSGHTKESVEYSIGMTTENTHSDKVNWKIGTTLGLVVSKYIATVNAQVEGNYGGEINSGHSTVDTGTERRKKNYFVDFSKPCYVYQLNTQLTLSDGSRGDFLGGLIVRDTPFPTEVLETRSPHYFTS